MTDDNVIPMKTEGALALACMADLLGMQRGMSRKAWLAQLRAAEADFATKVTS